MPSFHCCSYLHEHIVTLEKNVKLETLEAINEKIRKRYKNPKLSNSNCAKVCRHASVAWCRCLIISLAEITPSQPRPASETQTVNQFDGGLEYGQVLCLDLQTDELWSSAFEEPAQLKSLEKVWSPTLSKVKYAVIKKASDENLETANALLKSSYNFYRECSYVMPPSGVNLYLVPTRLLMEAQFHPSMDGAEILDLSVPRKIMLWAYTLLHGRYANISVVVKQCEENAKVWNTFMLYLGASKTFLLVDSLSNALMDLTCIPCGANHSRTGPLNVDPRT